jgi:hypothetical protein
VGGSLSPRSLIEDIKLRQITLIYDRAASFRLLATVGWFGGRGELVKTCEEKKIQEIVPEGIS